MITEDATAATPGGTAVGRDAVVAQAIRNHQDHRQLQHLITNVLVEQHGNRADVRADVVASFVTRASAPRPGRGGVYRFAVRRMPDGWRLTRIEVTPVWREASPAD